MKELGGKDRLFCLRDRWLAFGSDEVRQTGHDVYSLAIIERYRESPLLKFGIISDNGIYTAETFGTENQVKVYTPLGEPSDLISIGEYAGRTIAFIPRHGRGHTIPPHRINSRTLIFQRGNWSHKNTNPIYSRKSETRIQARRNCYSRPVYRLY